MPQEEAELELRLTTVADKQNCRRAKALQPIAAQERPPVRTTPHSPEREAPGKADSPDGSMI